MGFMWISLVFTAAFGVVIVSCQTDSSYTHNTFLDANEKYQIFWKFDEKEITFEVHVETTGYVGLGFSPTGEMLQSDIVTGWLKDGEVFLQDRFAEEDDSKPVIDDQNNYNLKYGEENGTHTILAFSRKLETCDDQDRTITEGTIRVIWAYGAEDPETEADLLYHRELNRGSKSIYLFDSPPVVPDLPENLSMYEFLNQNVSIPSNQDTTYWCQALKMPDLGGVKHHMVKVEPIIQEGHESLVHHILAYECRQKVNDSHDGYGHECFNPNMPEDLTTCNALFIAWAIGGGVYYFPENVGFPIGEEEDLNFVFMETHYDNPQFRTDYVDSSGIRIYYTSELREKDAGILMTGIGVYNGQAIPPASVDHISTAFCPQDCLNQALNALNDTEITIFSAVLHAHLAGMSLSARLFRDGKERATILQDNSYDFNYQEFREVNQLTMTSEDSIITQCKYNTEGRDVITYGGLGTQQEMCLTFIYYYPKIPVKTCLSFISQQENLAAVIGESVEGFFNSEGAFVITSPEEYINVTYTQVLEETIWTDEIRQALQDVQTTANSSIYCDANEIITFNEFIPYTVNDPFVEDSGECSTSSKSPGIRVPYNIISFAYFSFLLLNALL